MLVMTWLVFTAVAFWWFQFKNIQQFSPQENRQAAFFQAGGLAEQLMALQAGGELAAITVVHFWDPGCQCSRFNNAHVADLVSEYTDKGVRFVIVPAVNDVDQQEFVELFGVDARLARMNDIAMPSSPAAAVLDKDGHLAYFGPYSSGANCGSKAGAYVEKVLEKMLVGDKPRYLNMAAVGCFCDWENRG